MNFQTKSKVNQTLFEYIEVFYNRQRLHSSNGYLSPMNYEAKMLLATLFLPFFLKEILDKNIWLFWVDIMFEKSTLIYILKYVWIRFLVYNLIQRAPLKTLEISWVYLGFLEVP